jgi:hypothetical protein
LFFDKIPQDVRGTFCEGRGVGKRGGF